MNREDQLAFLNQDQPWDFVVIGGGASGLGTAVEAASRGYRTVLFEKVDFAKGTSSRSTKLLHGGVRYLAQGDVKLVMEALEERGLLAKNARHLFKNQTFIIPNYKWWEGFYYSFGLKLYDLLSRRLSLGKSKRINKRETLIKLPTLNSAKLVSGVSYQDGKFDDSRLAVNLAQTACEKGAAVMNYMNVVGLLKDENDELTGVEVADEESGRTYKVKAKVIVNATGVFANKILKLDDKMTNDVRVVPSQGIHLVLDKSFLQSDTALMIPKTSDGRVLFAVPWYDKVVLGTTDTLIKKPSFEPKPLDEEIDFILKTADSYLDRKPTRQDVLSVFAGLRPLVTPKKDRKNTKEISRGHKIMVSESKLITILGGKWTTYRKMAESIVDKAIEVHSLEPLPSNTRQLEIHGNIKKGEEAADDHLSIYGSDATAIRQLQSEDKQYNERLHPRYNYTMAEVVWSIRNEMARTVEDILARRVRLLFLDAQAAVEAAPKVAKMLAAETNRTSEWAKQQEEQFVSLAQNYILK